jgi:YHS domain-containing protein
MQVTDPLCGKSFDIDQSVWAAQHEGWMHFFCSSECQRRLA